ncbi:MarR family winged helix-turn-helix transcriptional regulator [Paraburkholderia sp. BL25I1N1]|uniref:MarR family winged helix-turn-helix transcriptional regulator n=1 Tax=Paraburkholderia sp. BL25I1N1 TaxID=1938804 RepID=UPI000D075047|nr:MarR family transcriptional regulator [Paraburkholderia sp. BL25I1N1]PRX92110.1 DNA-binding MarR family transcriptional regulator [Paraburkholderia sp. BL25I1N1]
MKSAPTAQIAPATTQLERFVPFKIYRVLAKLAVIASADYAAWEISIQEARLLLLVLERPGISAGDLCAAACVEASALSHMLRHLVAKNMLHRERNPTERRSVQIYLTDSGAVIARRCQQVSAKHQGILLSGLKKKDVESLHAILDHMLQNVTPQEPGPSPWQDISRAPRASR